MSEAVSHVIAPDNPCMWPFSKIVARPEKRNSRTVYEDIEALAESIRAHGLITPLTVEPGDDPETVEVISGFRRYKALKILKTGSREIPVVIKTVTPVEACFINLLENVERDDVSDADIAEYCLKLEVGEEGRDPVAKEEIAAKLGYSKSHATNLIRCARQLIPAAKRAWRQYDGASKFMFYLAGRDADEQKDELEKWIAKQKKEKEEGKAKGKAEDGDENSKPNGKAVKAMFEVLTGLAEEAGLKGLNKAYLDGRIHALMFISGDLSKRRMEQSEYRP